MTGRRITVKRGIKRGAGLLALAMSPFVRRDPGTACILMYHRLAPIDFVDQRTDDWNVTPAVFEGHMRMLAEIAAPVPLHTLRPGLIGSPSERPRVAVTFDDGYASVCRAAVPILVRYGIPATLFVTTAFVGTCEPMPFDRWGTLNRHRVDAETWLPAGWADIEQALSTGLISIGSHSHRHLEGRECSSERCAEEANRSRQELHTRLGCDQARTYAYPFGSSRHGDVTGQYESAVRSAGYELAVTTDPGLVEPEVNPFRMPRVEAHQLDSPRVLRAKIRGSLAPYHWTERLRNPVH